MSFHSQLSFSDKFFHVILGLFSPRLPSTCISHAVMIAPFDCSTYPYQLILPSHSLLFLKMRSRSWSSSLVCSFLDLTVATLLCFDIADLSDHGPVIVLQVLKVWLGQQPSFNGMEHPTLHERALHMATGLAREVARCENW